MKILALLGTASLGAATSLGALRAPQAPCSTDLASTSSGGELSNGYSDGPSLSWRGRYLAYASVASNLTPELDDNEENDVFVLDRLSGQVQLVSQNALGEVGSGSSSNPSISADGRFVAFVSEAVNLLPADTDSRSDIYVADTWTGTLRLVSVDSAGVKSNGFCEEPRISADGSRVCFSSDASNLALGDTGFDADVFAHDLNTGVTVMASRGPGGVEGDDESFFPWLSGDGRYLVFESTATNLVPGGTDGTALVFLRDLQDGSTRVVSRGLGGNEPSDDCYSPVISADGNRVAYLSFAGDIVPGDANGQADVFVWTRATQATVRASVSSLGAEANDESMGPSLSADGSLVAFSSLASNLAPGDANGNFDVFVHALATGSTSRVSLGVQPSGPVGASVFPAIAPRAHTIAFHGSTDDVVPGDDNGVPDIFVASCRN